MTTQGPHSDPITYCRLPDDAQWAHIVAAARIIDDYCLHGRTLAATWSTLTMPLSVVEGASGRARAFARPSLPVTSITSVQAILGPFETPVDLDAADWTLDSRGLVHVANYDYRWEAIAVTGLIGYGHLFTYGLGAATIPAAASLSGDLTEAGAWDLALAFSGESLGPPPYGGWPYVGDVLVLGTESVTIYQSDGNPGNEEADYRLMRGAGDTTVAEHAQASELVRWIPPDDLSSTARILTTRIAEQERRASQLQVQLEGLPVSGLMRDLTRRLAAYRRGAE